MKTFDSMYIRRYLCGDKRFGIQSCWDYDVTKYICQQNLEGTCNTLYGVFVICTQELMWQVGKRLRKHYYKKMWLNLKSTESGRSGVIKDACRGTTENRAKPLVEVAHNNVVVDGGFGARKRVIGVIWEVLQYLDL